MQSLIIALAIASAAPEMPRIAPDAPGVGRANVLAFGAVADGKVDASQAFAGAIASVTETGGTVAVPPGRYLLAGSISIPTGVALEGTWTGPHHGAWREGSTLLATAGRGSEDGPAAIEMRESSALRGFTIVHPEQQLSDIKPYPFAIHGTGMHCTIENVTLINSYNGIAMGPGRNELHLIRNVFGCALRRGLLIDGCTDIGRIENVHFNPHYWMRADYPGTPGVWRGRGADGKQEVRHPNEYMQEHLEGFIFARTDWEYVLNTFVFGANVGYRFIQTRNGAANGNFLGIGADWCTTSLRVDASQPMGILVTNGEFVGQPGCEAAVDVRGGALSLVNSSFWGPQQGNVRLEGPGSLLSIGQCIFLQWDSGRKGVPCIVANGGSLIVQGSSFLKEGRHIALGPGVRSAAIFGNTFRGGPDIENKAKGDVKIDLNVAPPK
ncbi:MAG: hypothetical protein JXP34_08065 [Planctomycetes bacterium]|nr:hypothetical protein [Planctomycetota bacterium]